MDVKGVHPFPKGISPKVNVIARQEFELAYYGDSSPIAHSSCVVIISVKDLNCLTVYPGG